MTASHSLTPISGTNGYQQSVEIDPGQPLHLSVSNASGKVRIVAADQSSIWIVVRRTDGQVGGIDEVAMTVNVDGNTISIHPDWSVASGLSGLTRRIRDQLQHGLNPDDWNISKLRLNPDLEYDIRVEIPRALAEGSTVNAKTASGDVDVSGVRGDLTVATASGSAAIADVKGKVSIHSASGSIRLSQVYGSLEANSASGSIRVDGGDVWTALRSASGSVHLNEVRLKNARIVTVSGSVKGNIIADNAADYAFKTVSGSVKLDATLPGTGRTSRLSYKSTSGSAKVGGDWRAEGKKSWTLGSGDDGPNIAVRTVSGSLILTGITDSNLSGRSEPMPDVPHDDDPDGTEPFAPDPSEIGRRVRAEIDRNVDFGKTAAWARDFAQSFSPPTPPVPPTPDTPATPDAPAAPPQPPAGGGGGGSWAWSSGSGTETRSGANNDTEPLPLSPATVEAEQEAAVAERNAMATDTSSPGAGDSERLQILEALERGEIDIDDALARIEREESRGT